MNKRRIGITLFLALLIMLLLFPIVILLNSSLSTYEAITKWPPRWFQEMQWSNYKEVLMGDKNIVEPFLNSLQVSIAVMLLCLFVGVLAAYAVTRFRFIGKKLFLFVILATQMFTSVILVNPMYIIFRNLGILDTKISLIIALTASCLPMTVWLLTSYFSQIPIDYEEASWMDGGSRLQGLKNIVAPLAFPGVITAGLFAFIASWGDLIFSKAFITSSELRTISLALMNYQDLYKTQWQLQMAASVITILPPFILFFGIQKYLIRSMVSQGIKG